MPSTALSGTWRRRRRLPCSVAKWTRRSSTASSGALMPRRSGRRVEVAGLAALGRELAQQRALGGAALEGEVAAVAERAARRQRLEVRRLAGDRAQLLRRGLVEARHRAEQARGIGVLRVGEQRIEGRRVLDDPAGVHHEHALAEARDDAEVVGDQHGRHAGLAPQPAQQLEDLRLHRDVERGRRLVGDQQRRVAEQRDRDHHALAHAARELVGVEVDAPGGGRDADQVEQLERAPARVALAHAAVLDQHLGHLARDPEVGVERGHRVLEDHREAHAADAVELAGAQADQLLRRESARCRCSGRCGR